MIQATLLRNTNGSYVLVSKQGETVDLGRRYPSKHRQLSAFRPAIGEEVSIADRTSRGALDVGERWCVVENDRPYDIGNVVVSRHLTSEGAGRALLKLNARALRLIDAVGMMSGWRIERSKAAKGARVRL